MLSFDVLTLFPEMILGGVQYGLLGQALKKDLLQVRAHNPRDFTADKHRSVDDRPFGGGDGMVMMIEPLEKTLTQVLKPSSYVVYLSPQGKVFTDSKARELSQKENVILVCGRYGGLDQRLINHYVDEEISIGDYVLSGGEVAALTLIEATSRFVPGVLGHEESPEKDSFAQGLLEDPAFTRPREYLGEEVPEALLSGNHGQIEEWKKKVSLLVTLKKRPDLYHKFFSRSENSTKKISREILKKFYAEMKDSEKKALGLEGLAEEDFTHV